jgi:hypothetical protein
MTVMFGSLRKALSAIRFVLDEDVKIAVVQRFDQLPSEFFAEEIHQLVVSMGCWHEKQSLLLRAEQSVNRFHLNKTLHCVYLEQMTLRHSLSWNPHTEYYNSSNSSVLSAIIN